ncbi:3-oxoacyl-[acyl-carrier-protein] synthase-3 [Aneurinibacillus soli]|uniref:3-oxoacyl-[acyl-carrier-protein] synthase 3 n=1 Tax=Aneurinibacillus soli TaxID=1500254 RepID=A0A0U5BAE4_9BACL|nr:beta-ketoacyl-ACP synthase III [Aneurinibacillus soli]PYE63344.1 3-oxoacyl-[acyl-carrier-protein] synthase-3 [Aneurinibacillus soli]BAU27725.1 3-oxoacyl-[acyl-carrier-protein] synthase 3 [Aneurinibacillus soli]
MERQIKLLGTGAYLPKRRVMAEELDRKLGMRDGWTVKKSGVAVRHYVDGETASQMGAAAVREALAVAGLTFADLDCLVCASGTAQQEIPCTAALIQEQLGEGMSGVPCFDVNSTCLSFVTALDAMSYLVHAGRYERMVIVSTEIASVGLNWSHKESCVLFGDGAVAVVIGRTPAGESSRVLTSHMETYSKGAHLSEIRGGGSMIHPREYVQGREEDFVFDMDGRAIFRLTSKLIDGYVERLFAGTGLTMNTFDLVIPHQASGMAMRIMREKLGIPRERFMDVIGQYGNVIAASIPLALHEAIQQKRMQRGDTVLLIGTSAGLSLGGVAFVY